MRRVSDIPFEQAQMPTDVLSDIYLPNAFLFKLETATSSQEHGIPVLAISQDVAGSAFGDDPVLAGLATIRVHRIFCPEKAVLRASRNIDLLNRQFMLLEGFQFAIPEPPFDDVSRDIFSSLHRMNRVYAASMPPVMEKK